MKGLKVFYREGLKVFYSEGLKVFYEERLTNSLLSKSKTNNKVKLDHSLVL